MGQPADLESLVSVKGVTAEIAETFRWVTFGNMRSFVFSKDGEWGPFSDLDKDEAFRALMEASMTMQSTWIPKDPALQVGETVVVTAEYSSLKGVRGKITAILGPHESMWMRTDRWFVLEVEDQTIPADQLGFLEDEIERVP